jgi:hypothetical protein
MGLIEFSCDCLNPVRVVDGDGLENRMVTRLSLYVGDSNS